MAIQSRNRLLGALLEPATLDLRKIIEFPGKPIEHVYFVETGFVLGDDRSSREAMVQAEGSGWRLSAAALRGALKASPTMRRVLLRYAHAFLEQTSQTALSNGRAMLEERLARWLLMAHDRLGRDDLAVTHDLLALMLGMRRPGVTVAVHLLEGRSLIKASRGRIAIVSRAGLVALADGSHGTAEAAYERLIGSPATQM